MYAYIYIYVYIYVCVCLCVYDIYWYWLILLVWISWYKICCHLTRFFWWPSSWPLWTFSVSSLKYLDNSLSSNIFCNEKEMSKAEVSKVSSRSGDEAQWAKSELRKVMISNVYNANLKRSLIECYFFFFKSKWIYIW